ncbi:hypothetical protein [Streptomyces sp. NPDC000851]
MSDRSPRSLLIAAVLGGLVGSALTLCGAVLVMPSQGDRGPTGPRGAQGPAGPPGVAAEALSEEDVTALMPDLDGTYVIEGPLGCPTGSLPSRTVKIPDTELTRGETLQLCYIQPSAFR